MTGGCERSPALAAQHEPSPALTAQRKPSRTPTGDREPNPAPASERKPSPAPTSGCQPRPAPTAQHEPSPALIGGSQPSPALTTQRKPSRTPIGGREPNPAPTSERKPSRALTSGRQPSPALTAQREASPAPTAGCEPSPALTAQQEANPAPTGGPKPRAALAGGPETGAVPTVRRQVRLAGLVEGWRYILVHRGLRPLFFNVILVNGLNMAAQPLMALLMLGQLGFTPWQYGLAFAAPCVGGLVGSRMAGRLVGRFGTRRIMRAFGALRACWQIGLVFVHPGAGGLVLVMAVELGVITCFGVFNPVLATYRLSQVPADRVARALSAWSVASKASIAALTFLCGLLAGLIGPRPAIAVAGLVMLVTPFLLPRNERTEHQEREPARSPA
ncbi:MFS transporter [Amycolatopsis saalfeldensis]|uniref:MFS transporter n=1 Tax=Amycolatopsis saalfeldensis TaxID=394193 RepID=UPI003CCB7C09